MTVLPNIHADSETGKYIFVSYAHKDSKIAFPFIEALQKRHNVWFDEGIHYGNEWEEEIAEKLENCSIFIFLITEESLVSNNCKDELYTARELEKPFINVLMDRDMDLPRAFRLRYGRYQMCKYYTFSSPADAIEDLEKKCDWFKLTRKCSEPSGTQDGFAKSVESTLAAINALKPTEALKLTNRISVGSIVKFGKYIQEENGTPVPIEWQVLEKEGDTALIISKYALDCQPYNDLFSEVVWTACSLREWLTKTFYRTAFNSTEQNAIVDIYTDAHNSLRKNGVTDKVFLLSTAEANRYFSSNVARQCTATAYAQAKGADTSSENGKCWWWLRSNGSNYKLAARVRHDGTVGSYGCSVNFKTGAVRPALWVKLDA